MIDLRLYRIAFAPALLAVVAAMFSLAPRADPLEPAVPPASFDGGRAAATARQIAALAPEREPGTEGDDAVADLVAGRFEEVRSGSVSEQLFEDDHDGDEVELRNVVLTLPGDAESAVVVLAPRASTAGPDTAGTAAATGVLTELANVLGVAGHEKTYVLASIPTDGAGASGALGLLDGLPEGGAVEAVIVISQPGAAAPRQPYVVASSTGESSPSVQLVRTAALAVSTQVGSAPREPSAVTELARLAVPSGLGAQAPLLDAGLDAVAISSAGERPLPPSAGDPEDLSPERLDGFGRAVQSTIGAVDAATAPLAHGPSTYVGVAGNLVPGWALALLGLALLVPAAFAAVDACARAARRSQPVVPALGWAAARALPLLGALLALYALALVGVIPRPGFPFDPGREPFGIGAAIVLALLLATALGTAIALRRLRAAAAIETEAAPAALGAVSVTACLVIWIANPFLGLLAAPAAHVWLLAGTARRGRGRAVTVTVAGAVALAPTAVALGCVAAALKLGADAPWFFVLMVADGQIGLGAVVPACFVAAALAAAVALAAPRPPARA